ncbi:hypothetical protein DHEL01_v200339 [Diaporthe helianthi]|uniref:Uncharacterized protein n=1 Tax=Diaporthe helianthi TaxID=158607 RepID=A0A2P5IFL5_DIAHE|nr:hypothetical protein DHEL01_v200339 [Diaporthe helianthi]
MSVRTKGITASANILPQGIRSAHGLITGRDITAYKLGKHLSNNVTFSIYEKSHDLGGTWLENKYPGRSVIFTMITQGTRAGTRKFSPCYIYASSDEIHWYLKRFASVHGLDQFIHFNSKVVEAKWSETSATWNIKIDGRTDVIQSEILINAGGILNNPKLPSIPGFSKFTGQQLHTASWDPSVNLEGKRVAMIGAGASAVQLLPQIQPLCSHVDVYIRTPSWITAPAGITLIDAENPNPVYSMQDKDRFANDEDAYLETRKELEDYLCVLALVQSVALGAFRADIKFPSNDNFRAFFKKTPEQKSLKAQFESRMKELITDKDLQEKLIPSFEAGCRRINPGEQYLVALQKPNVRAIFDPIEEITATGVVVSGGVEHPADVLIAATGFDTTFRPRFPIIGRDGLNLQDLWHSDPTSYMGIGVAGFPNYLTFLGPNTPISNGSLMEKYYGKEFDLLM